MHEVLEIEEHQELRGHLTLAKLLLWLVEEVGEGICEFLLAYSSFWCPSIPNDPPLPAVGATETLCLS